LMIWKNCSSTSRGTSPGLSNRQRSLNFNILLI
jgi:hypothetical protein